MIHSVEIRDNIEARNDGKKLKIVLVGYTIPNHVFQPIAAADPRPANQTVNFSWALAEALQYAGEVRSLSFIPIRDFPQAKKLIFGPRKLHNRGIRISILPFINLPVIKHLTRFGALITKACVTRPGDLIVVHGLHLPGLLFACILQLFGRATLLVLTDEQGTPKVADPFLIGLLRKLDAELSRILSFRFDLCLALSSSLYRKYGNNRPALIVPGIYSELAEHKFCQVFSRPRSGRFTVSYFGGLSAEYGVRLLIEAATLLPDDICIQFFGSGPLEAEIVERARFDKRVIWGGLLDRKGVAIEMACSDALINARPSQNRLAQMSSPSKIIEYATSGRPVITTIMSSFSEKMKHSCVPIHDETPQGVAEAIMTMKSLVPADAEAIGKSFQAAVKAECSARVVGARILDLMEELHNRASV